MKNRHKFKGILSILLVVCLLVGTVNSTVFAQEEIGSSEAPSEEVVSASTEGVSYKDENGGDKTCSAYTSVSNGTTTWETGWYVVDSDTVTISERVLVSGTVNLILEDGCTLNADAGITVNSGNVLNMVYFPSSRQ